MTQEDYFRQLKQGDLLRSTVDGIESELAIVSQTCDVVQPKRETVLLAPVVESLSETEARGAADRSNPRYVLVGEKYIDLGKINYFPKESLDGAEIVGGLLEGDNQLAREFALGVGRWFSRFAVPDELHPWLNPLQKLIRSKFVKDQSPLHVVLQDVVEIRVESDQWFEPGRHLTVHVIVKTSALPLTFETQTGLSPSENAVTGKRNPSVVAAEMMKVSAPYSELLWTELAWSFADTCKLSNSEQQNPDFAQAVSSVGAQLWTEDEFPLSHMRRSEQLDIDFLSEPQPM